MLESKLNSNNMSIDGNDTCHYDDYYNDFKHGYDYSDYYETLATVACLLWAVYFNFET